MKVNSRFIVVKHDAKKARLHYDLRFVMPKSKIWASFAVRKGVPEKPGVKVLAVKTHDHDEKEALFLGTIKDGYGAGKLTKFDDGKCIIHKYKSSHIIVEFKGRKIKGIYHLINTGVFNKKDYKKQQYMLFKGNALKEGMGMISRVPSGGIAEDTEEGQNDLETPKLPWSNNKSRRIVAAEQLYQMLKDYII
ncbi:MAG: DNA polymerase ligase N-terminal domain-containing protein [Candidatus Heimdallarchaeaceae archaeon]